MSVNRIKIENIEERMNSSQKFNDVMLNNASYSDVDQLDLSQDNVESISYDVRNQNYEDIEKLNKIIDGRISELKEKLKELSNGHRVNFWGLLVSLFTETEYTKELNNASIENNLKENSEIQALREEINYLESLSYRLNQELLMRPYNEIMNTAEYQNYVNEYSYNNSGIDFKAIQSSGYDIDAYIFENYRNLTGEQIDNLVYSQDLAIDGLAVVEYIIDDNKNNVDIYSIANSLPNLQPYFDLYLYTSEDQRMMYHYIYEIKGEEAAEEYRELLSDKINQAKGAAQAAEFIEKLDLNDRDMLNSSLANYFDVSVKGLNDGIETFYEGIDNILENNGTISSNEYSRMIVLDYLQKNSNLYDEIYEFHSSLGNMIPAMATSAVTSVLATPAAGEVVGSVLMGASAAGNAKHQALVNGNGVLESTIYGMLVGVSESTLGYFLGKIPGISKEAGFTLKNLLSEGTEEFLQEWVQAGLQAAVLGENVDLSTATSQSVESFFMGVLMAGFLNGGQSVVNLTVNGVNMDINVNEVLDYIDENTGASILEAVSNSNTEINKANLKSIDTHGNQSSLFNKLTKKIKSKALKQDLIDIKNTLKKYYPNLSDQEFLQFSRILKENGCTFVATIESLLKAINFDENTVSSIFGYDLYDSNGNINYDRMVADLYAFASNYVRIRKSVPAQRTFSPNDSAIEICKALTGIQCTTEADAVIQMINQGWRGNGFSSNGQLIYINERESTITEYAGTIQEVYEQMTGIKNPNITVREFKNFINGESGIQKYFKEAIIPAEIGVDNTRTIDINNIEYILNAFLASRGVENIRISAKEIEFSQIPDMLNNNIPVIAESGNYSNSYMHNGKFLGGAPLYNSGTGHAMPVVGISDNGELIVASWGEEFTFLKEKNVYDENKGIMSIGDINNQAIEYYGIFVELN